jgi:uncharacterized membrane protein
MFLFSKKKPLLSPDAQEIIVSAIKEAERKTTGEIRVFIESKCSFVDAQDRALEIFKDLKMDRTVRRNAVMVYLAIQDHQFAIIGDEQIHVKAGGQTFWESAAQKLKEYLGAGMIAEGLAFCINELGIVMAHHFPYDPEVHKNELPDEIVFGK